MAYTALTSAQTDADSPLNQTLFDLIRTNSAHFATAINSATATIETDKVIEGSILASAVSLGKLKVDSESGSIANSNVATLIELSVVYGHIISLTWARSSGTGASIRNGFPTRGASFTNKAPLWTMGDGSSPVNNTYSYGSNYHAACPPHAPFKAGSKSCGEWGLFVYLLRDKSDGQLFASWCRTDPVWHVPDSVYGKDAPELIAASPHPIMMVDEAQLQAAKPGAKLELVMVDTREYDMAGGLWSPEAFRAERLREISKQTADEDRSLELEWMAMDLEKKAKPEQAFRRDTLTPRASLIGKTAWDLLIEEFPKLLQATETAKEDGKPIRSGVPAFDDTVPILRP